MTCSLCHSPNFRTVAGQNRCYDHYVGPKPPKPRPPEPVKVIVTVKPPRTKLDVIYGIQYDFAGAFKVCRKLAGMSQHEIKRAFGIQRTYITKLEHGSLDPSLRSAERQVKACGFSMAEFCYVAQVLGEAPDGDLS